MSGALPSRSRGRWRLVLTCFLLFSAGMTALLYLTGNGLTSSAAALSTVPGLLLALLLHQTGKLRPGWFLRIALTLLLFDGAYIAWRIDAYRRASPGIVLCDRTGCGARATPIEAMIPPESETAMAGMALSKMLGTIRGAESDELSRLLRLEYAGLDASPSWEGVPNGPIVGLRGASGRYLFWAPAGQKKLPCLVFLHGFGGQLSIYVKAIVESDIDRHFAVVAPFGGPVGAFWRGDAAEEVKHLIDEGLPDNIDGQNVFLMGLSNGAMGATSLGLYTPLGAKLRGVIALSGIAPASEPQTNAPPLLVITGQQDPRFRFPYIEHQLGALGERGVNTRLEAIEGDHFIILSKKAEVMKVAYEFMSARLVQ